MNIYDSKFTVECKCQNIKIERGLTKLLQK